MVLQIYRSISKYGAILHVCYAEPFTLTSAKTIKSLKVILKKADTRPSKFSTNT